jgi:hypothetical protein
VLDVLALALVAGGPEAPPLSDPLELVLQWDAPIGCPDRTAQTCLEMRGPGEPCGSDEERTGECGMDAKCANVPTACDAAVYLD